MKTKVNKVNKVIVSESEASKKYYSNQLNKLVKSEFSLGIKLYDNSGNSTNVLAVNNDSIEVLVEYLNSLKK